MYKVYNAGYAIDYLDAVDNGDCPIAAPSSTMIPRIQQFTKKKAIVDAHRPGKKVLAPRNSNWNPCCSQAPCVITHNASAEMPSFGDLMNEEYGRYRGKNTMYQRKY